jgi:predicted alpha/beta hydrolase
MMTAISGGFQPEAAVLEFLTADGVRLSGILHRPAGDAVAAVVLHGAVGVPQSYYQAFAAWLARVRGMACLTYDYRDFGASARGPVKGARATLADWGVQDQPAALKAIGQAVPGRPVWVIGHSLGGIMLGFHPGMANVARVITLGSGAVQFRDHPWPYKAQAALFWYGHGPALVRAAGYLPGRFSGLGVDLPAGVYWQWRRWCTQAGGFFTDVGRSLPMPDASVIRAPLKMIAVADDPMVPQAAVWRLMALHLEAPKTQLVLRAEDHGLRRIGHLAAFSRRNAVVWPQILA